MPKPLFSERLTPAKGTVAALLLSGPMVLLAALPFDQTLAFILAGIVPTALIALAFLRAPEIILTRETLSVGRMNLPLSALGRAEVFEGDQARLQRGPALSPGSQRLFRGDVDAVVKIAVTDPADPTDYLLFSARRGAELVSALDANRS